MVSESSAATTSPWASAARAADSLPTRSSPMACWMDSGVAAAAIRREPRRRLSNSEDLAADRRGEEKSRHKKHKRKLCFEFPLCAFCLFRGLLLLCFIRVLSALIRGQFLPATILMRSPRRIQYQLRAVTICKYSRAFHHCLSSAQGIDNLPGKDRKAAAPTAVAHARRQLSASDFDATPL